MALTLSKTSIEQTQIINAWHVTQSVDAFTGAKAYDITISGSLTLTGSVNSANGYTGSLLGNAFSANSASWATNAVNTKLAESSSKEYIASNATTNTEYSLVFKNSTAALNDYHQLGADGTNGPFYNPSTNTLTVPTLSGSSLQTTSITGSLLGNVTGTASFASNGVTNLSVGTFYDTTTQTVVAGASASITLNSPVISDGVSVVSNSRLTVTRAGIYNLQFSAQVQTTVGGSPTVYIWLRKNGNNMPYSNTAISIQNQNQQYVGAWNFVESLIPGDYLELVWYVDGGASAQLIAAPAGPTNGGVGVPSVIVTMTQIK